MYQSFYWILDILAYCKGVMMTGCKGVMMTGCKGVMMTGERYICFFDRRSKFTGRNKRIYAMVTIVFLGRELLLLSRARSFDDAYMLL